MGITIDEAMNNLSGILTEATEDEDSVCYVTKNDAETLQIAIDTMRKYKKIKQILKEPCIIPEGCYPMLKRIKREVEDEKGD